MADDFLVKMDGGGRVFVLLHAGCQIGKERILELLQAAGIDVAMVIFLAPEDVEACRDFDHACVLIPIDAAICDSPELDRAGRHCGQAGGRVVVLFANTFPYEGLHPIAEKYGTQCDWSAGQLGLCLSSNEPVEPRSGTGTPVVRPHARPVKC